MKREETINTLRAQYACTFRPEKGGGFTVRCAAFPELITNGRNLEEARHNAREALELCLEVYKDEGGPIPPSDGSRQDDNSRDAARQTSRSLSGTAGEVVRPAESTGYRKA